jgi:prepilin-type N-terminal cleavage/methylation domain-containing protein
MPEQVENTADRLSERGLTMYNVRLLNSNETSADGLRRPRAFTLIEILAVIVILAIAAMIAIPAFSGASEMQMRAAADKLAADIEYAKSLAVTTQKPHRVTFDTVLHKYEIREMSADAVINDPVRKTPFVVQYTQDSRLSSVTIQSATFGTGSAVEFSSTGTPEDAGGTALGTAGTVVLEAKGQTITVKVEPVTGYVTIQ